MTEEMATKSLIILKFADEEMEFIDTDELHDFMQSERNAWSWLLQAVEKENNLNRMLQIYNNYFNNINQFLLQFPQYQDNEAQLNSLKNSLKHQTEQAVNQGFNRSESANAKFIFSLKDKSTPLVAGYALAFLSKQSLNFNTFPALEGAFCALQFLKGTTDTVEAAQQNLESTKRSWNIKFGKQHKEISGKKELLIGEIETLKSQYGELVLMSKKQIEDQDIDYKSKMTEVEQRLNDIEHTYDEKLALQSSVQYWTAKRTHHQTVIWWLAAITIFFALLTGFGFIWAAYELLKETFVSVPLWKLGVMIGISSFGIWLTRLSAKIFISNLHLRTDADERVTMIQTYLALLREGSGPKIEERQLILQTLFRPSATGFIKDDGPTMFYESILKTVK
ncbi:DUF6161 domain-containing protein [Legionella sp. 29fVS95]|uniref:DUF6161 domain-containing protein n=1 Tax=Legionella sp. 29fVS95 TaxID=3402813 RepID=UPI003AF83A12